jgi:hypothetical protein
MRKIQENGMSIAQKVSITIGTAFKALNPEAIGIFKRMREWERDNLDFAGTFQASVQRFADGIRDVKQASQDIKFQVQADVELAREMHRIDGIFESESPLEAARVQHDRWVRDRSHFRGLAATGDPEASAKTAMCESLLKEIETRVVARLPRDSFGLVDVSKGLHPIEMESLFAVEGRVEHGERVLSLAQFDQPIEMRLLAEGHGLRCAVLELENGKPVSVREQSVLSWKEVASVLEYEPEPLHASPSMH